MSVAQRVIREVEPAPQHRGGHARRTTAAPVLCDLRAIQSPDYRGRGIGRWAYELATALERVCPDLVGAYLLDPEWPPPGAVDELLSTGKLAYSGTSQAQRAVESARVYHCFSPFELGRPISAVRPPFVDQRGMAYAVVAYDLIPLRHPETYLVHPAQRRRYGARLEVLRSADAVLAISDQAGADVRELLGVESSRCHVIGTGVSRHFVPPASRKEVLSTLCRSMDGLNGPFILYPGGNDGRKNIDGLIAAFSDLPNELRDGYQLVVVGDLPPLTTNHYRYLAQLAGIEDRVVLTGFVSDDRLTELYQATDLLVFPSFAEGYGLPIAEALASGAVAAVSDRAPFDKLVVEPGARFDPLDTADIASTIERCLTDESLRCEVRRAATETVATWDDVARRAAFVFDDLAGRRRRPWTRKQRIAVISPFPPLPSGVAGYSAMLVDALQRAASRRVEAGEGPIEIDCFADGLNRYPIAPEPIGGKVPRDARTFEISDGAIGSYEHVVYVLGNSAYHSNALAALRRRRGIVFTHDVRLSGLMTFSTETPGAVPGGLQATIKRAYGTLPDHLGCNGSIEPADRDRYGLILLRDVLSHTDRLLVSSESARNLAELDYGTGLTDWIGVLPFAMARLSIAERAAVGVARREARAARAERSGPALIASYGIVDPGKRPGTLVATIAELTHRGLDVELALVGSAGEEIRKELMDLAAALGITDKVRLLGEVEWADYLRLLGEADLAVQLRLRYFGESSGAVSECLSAALPTIVSDLGWMGELPDDAVYKVPHECLVGELAGAIEQLLLDESRRVALAKAGERFASEQTFDDAAEALLKELGL